MLLDRVGGERRALILTVGVATIVAIVALSRWASAPAWVPLFPGMPISMVGDVTALLDEQGLKYRLEAGGSSVQVAEPDLARARVALAREGLPSAGRPGFELFDQPSWGMTDFTQRINYRRALEGELERTIGGMRGVEGAQVHLALHESSLLRRSADARSAASVVLRLRAGARPGPELVEGVASLVASAVDGLLSDNVTVLDQNGRVLNATSEAGTGLGLTRRQLAAQREVELHLEEKAEELLGQIVGTGNARVRVAAAMSFDRVDRTVQSVDPDRQVALREETAEIIPGSESAGAASVTTSTVYDVARTLETFSSGIGSIERLTVSVLINHRRLGLGEQVRMEPRSQEELAQVEALVRNAVGINSVRGDALTVVNVLFDAGDAAVLSAPAANWDIMQLIENLQRPVLGLIGLILAFVLAGRVLKMLRQPTQGTAVPVAALAAPEAGRVSGRLTHADASGGAVHSQGIPAEGSRRDKVAAAVLERPELASRVVRAWIRES
jgi:flagellar M-ring protein FliF